MTFRKRKIEKAESGSTWSQCREKSLHVKLWTCRKTLLLILLLLLVVVVVVVVVVLWRRWRWRRRPHQVHSFSQQRYDVSLPRILPHISSKFPERLGRKVECRTVLLFGNARLESLGLDVKIS